jgi:hypothetical protein
LDHKAFKVFRDQQDRRVLLEILDRRGTKVFKVFKALKDFKEPRVFKVLAVPV